MKNNIFLGAIGGSGAAILGACIWALVTVFSGFQIGWMAVGVGFLVGFAVKLTGQGDQQIFGFIGAGLALLGCLLGNLLSGIGFIAQDAGVGYFEAFTSFDFSASFDLLKAMFAPMDLLFYGIGMYEGYKFSIND